MKECSLVAWVPLQWSSHFKKGKKGSVKDLSAVRPASTGSPELCACGRVPSWLGASPLLWPVLLPWRICLGARVWWVLSQGADTALFDALALQTQVGPGNNLSISNSKVQGLGDSPFFPELP